MNFEFLESHDIKIIYKLLSKEHPQIIAFILSRTSTDYAKNFLNLFSEENRIDIFGRMLNTFDTKDSVYITIRENLDDRINRFIRKENNTEKLKSLFYLLSQEDSSKIKTIYNF
jgi:flagellar motor switch protein FliG